MTAKTMDYISEAKRDLEMAINEPEYGNDADWLQRCAQTEALISIAESLATLAAAVRDGSLEIHEVK